MMFRPLVSQFEPQDRVWLYLSQRLLVWRPVSLPGKGQLEKRPKISSSSTQRVSLLGLRNLKVPETEKVQGMPMFLVLSF